jgi:hypothetical protein
VTTKVAFATVFYLFLQPEIPVEKSLISASGELKRKVLFQLVWVKYTGMDDATLKI